MDKDIFSIYVKFSLYHNIQTKKSRIESVVPIYKMVVSNLLMQHFDDPYITSYLISVLRSKVLKHHKTKVSAFASKYNYIVKKIQRCKEDYNQNFVCSLQNLDIRTYQTYVCRKMMVAMQPCHKIYQNMKAILITQLYLPMP